MHTNLTLLFSDLVHLISNLVCTILCLLPPFQAMTFGPTETDHNSMAATQTLCTQTPTAASCPLLFSHVLYTPRTTVAGRINPEAGAPTPEGT